MTVRKVIKGLPDTTEAPAPKTTEDIERAEAMRIQREKARLHADRVIEQYRQKITPQKAPERPGIPSNMNDTLIHP
jgi:hypothetical protein